MHILIIEDDKKTAAYLRKGLSENGFVANVAHQAEDGLHLLRTEHYDLVILDVMLPGPDGWSVLSEMRRSKVRVPVIFLTARDSVEDRVKGLELGADDYLVKPFHFSELLARLHCISRREAGRQPEVFSILDLEIDFLKHMATRAGKRLDLTPKEFALLSFLARRRGEVLSRTLISEQVWDINFDSDTNVVDVAIKRLRRKVDDDYTEKLIHTVRGVGYVLEAR